MRSVASECYFFFYNLPRGHIGEESVVPYASFNCDVAGHGIARLELTDSKQDRFGFACDECFARVVAVLVLDDKVLFLPGLS